MKEFKIVWSDNAIASLQSIKDFISDNSSVAANKVVKGIIDSVDSLEQHPHRFQEDEFIKTNPGSIRRFFKWNYRIIYEIHDSISRVEIIDIIHTSRQPKF